MVCELQIQNSMVMKTIFFFKKESSKTYLVAPFFSSVEKTSFLILVLIFFRSNIIRDDLITTKGLCISKTQKG